METIKKYFNDEVDFKRDKYDNDINFKKYPKHYKILNSIKNKDVLSLGCGTGREVKLLVMNNNKVVGIDFAEKVIEKSRQAEPNAEYHCENLIEYEDNRKYDYIIALSSVMNYIKRKEDRYKFASKYINMLRERGEIIFGLKLRENLRTIDYLRVILASFVSILKADKDYSFGDIYYKKPNNKGEKVYPVKIHLYSIRELKIMFKNMNIKIIPESTFHLIRIN